jgi:hypothetical protein
LFNGLFFEKLCFLKFKIFLYVTGGRASVSIHLSTAPYTFELNHQIVSWVLLHISQEKFNSKWSVFVYFFKLNIILNTNYIIYKCHYRIFQLIICFKVEIEIIFNNVHSEIIFDYFHCSRTTGLSGGGR